jgi:hypothetical protein
VSFAPNPIPAPGSGNSTMTITVGSSTPVGTYPITVTGNGGGIQQNTTVTLTVTAQQQPNFTISASPYALNIAQGNPGTSAITTTISGGFNSAISLSASGVPSGTTVSFAPNPIPAPGAGISTMTIAIGSGTVTGIYPITITGTGGGIKQTATFTLTVVFPTDTYGGLTAAPVPGCNQTGYFQLIKVKGRWVYADPDCNAFYQRSVYDADRGFILQQIMQSRYNNSSAAWAKHSLQRMTGWGFNSVDIYYSLYMLPVPWGNNPGASIQVPFVAYYPALKDVLLYPQNLGLPEAVKDICKGFDSNGYNYYCSNLVDVFDPKWQTGNSAELVLQQNTYTGGFSTDPWITSISLGDSDFVFAIKGNGSGYPHAGMLIATVNFQYTGFQDNKLYAKYAWASYLQNKYGNIAALNAAWNTGGFYTSFGDAGGFGSGTGILDEDGRHTAWFGSDLANRYFTLVGVNPNLVADMDAFLYQYTYQVYAVQANTIKTYDQNHLLTCGNFGGIGEEGGIRPPVMQALKDAGCNIVVGNWNSTYPSVALAGNQAFYDATGVPVYIWYGISAQMDSDLSQYPNDGAPYGDYQTQLLRGQQYAVDQQTIFSAQGGNGDYYILGTSFWSLTDNSSEGTNWGLITFTDNAYDGKCAVIGQSTDRYGYPCGGEVGNYGDFLDSVTQSHLTILQQLIQQLSQ